MRLIGFSTGSLAKGDFRRALELLRGTPTTAVELSALREWELQPLVDALDSLDLAQFKHVSVHAPSQFSALKEGRVISLLRTVVDRGWPIILHPDAVSDFSKWDDLGDLLYIENMDKRKGVGRTSQELDDLWALLPKASLCFDMAHARQVDSSMTEAYRILKHHGGRIRQLHLSEVNAGSGHGRLSLLAVSDFSEVAHLIPSEAPAILETMVTRDQIAEELERAIVSLTPVRSTKAV